MSQRAAAAIKQTCFHQTPKTRLIILPSDATKLLACSTYSRRSSGILVIAPFNRTSYYAQFYLHACTSGFCLASGCRYRLHTVFK